MLNSKFTPGKWDIMGVTSNPIYYKSNKKTYQIVEGNDFGKKIAQRITSEANARLIASAPELLEACRTSERIIKNLCEQLNIDVGDLNYQNEQIIAKAEGTNIKQKN